MIIWLKKAIFLIIWYKLNKLNKLKILKILKMPVCFFFKDIYICNYYDFDVFKSFFYKFSSYLFYSY